MSSFIRTTSGLNNQHLFYNVDLIVYLEGGSISHNKSEVYSGSYNEETLDIIFWSNIFGHFKSDKKFKFKSVGSKTTILEISQDILSGQLNTVLVAMDNEFDEIFKQRIEHPCVYYTYGYSWENDVWNYKIIKSIIEEITTVKIVNSDIELNFNEFLKKMKLAVFADGYMFKKNASFFPRKTGYMFCVNCIPVDLPEVKQSDLNDKLITKGLKKGTLYAFGRKHSIDTLKYCYGHLLADYSCQLIKHYIKNRHSLTNLSNEIMYRMGLSKYFQNSFNDGHIYDYYDSQFKKNWA